jgi:ferredoxin
VKRAETAIADPARRAALAALKREPPARVRYVEYTSRGSLLIIGEAERATEAARRLRRLLRVVAVVSGSAASTVAAPRGVNVLIGELAALTGYLGRFRAELAGQGGARDLGSSSPNEDGYFDLVLDLSDPPLLRSEVLPPGYFAVGSDDGAVVEACTTLSRLGEKFSKPEYVQFRSQLCVHGRKGIHGCERCLSACPAQAIASVSQQIQVDTHLCQGCGSCTAVCPTGAVSYAYPAPLELRRRVWTALDAFRAAGGESPSVVFHDSSTDEEELNGFVCRSPGYLPFRVNSVGSVGMDILLTSLAYGARQVTLLLGRTTPSTVVAALTREVQAVRDILAATSAPERIELAGSALAVDGSDATFASIRQPPVAQPPVTDPGKRATILQACDRLSVGIPSESQTINLSHGAVFGKVEVDANKCTMCMACVVLCPTDALISAERGAALDFVEARCVQCGICKTGCPEQAIRLVPRFLYDKERRSKAHRLNAAEKARCIECGRPFMPQALLDASFDRVRGNPVFDGKGAQLLKTCPDCRAQSAMLNHVLAPTGGGDP